MATGSESSGRVWVGVKGSDDEKCLVLKSEDGVRRVGDWKWEEWWW